MTDPERDAPAALMNTYQICRAAFPSDNPEWQKPYSYLSKLDDDVIAFEFLRRSPSYWQFFASVARRDPMEWPLEIAGPFWSEKDKSALDNFGIWKLCDPRRPLPPYSRLWTVEASLSARYLDAINRADAENSFDYSFHKSATFHLRVDLLIEGPVDEQIDFVRWLLIRAQRACWTYHKEAPRPPRRHFATYLALLDARCDGVSFPKIAHQLYGAKGAREIDRVKKQYKAAVRLRDSGYRELLLWGKISKPACLVVRDHPF